MTLRRQAVKCQRFILAIVLLWLSCGPALAMPREISRIPGHPRLSIGWNPNLETVFLLALLGSSELPAAATPLQRQAWRDFSRYRGSLAAQTAYRLLQDSWETFVYLPLAHAPLPQAQPFPGQISQCRPWQKFWAEVRDFYVQARIGSWLTQHQRVYQLGLVQALAALPEQDLLGLQETYHRRRFSQYKVLISQFLPSSAQSQGAWGSTLKLLPDTGIAYEMVGPVQDMNHHWTFGDRENMIYLMLRDFGHAFCDDIVAGSQAENLSGAGATLQTQRWQRQALVHAVHARLVLQLYGPEAYERHLQSEERQGLGLIRQVAEQLQIYEQNPERYPAFADFYGQLLPTLKSVAELQFSAGVY